MALPRLVTRLSTAPVSQDRMPSPAADWYTVIVTRSRALAASNTPPAMLLPTSDAISEHCRSNAAQDCPAMPYWSYRVGLAVLGVPAGGRIRASIPPVAGSGVGTDGWQMLFRSPTMPLDPEAQKPNRPPMSPIPGTEQIPPDGPAGCAGAWTAVVVTVPVGSVAWAGVALSVAWAGVTAAWATAGMPSIAATAPASSSARQTG